VDGVRDDGEGAPLEEDTDEGIIILDSVIGGSLDTDVTTEPVGLKKDVSSDISPQHQPESPIGSMAKGVTLKSHKMHLSRMPTWIHELMV
jgi:hypothetical protein